MELHTGVSYVRAFQRATLQLNQTHVGVVVDRRGFEAVEFVMMSEAILDGVHTPLVEHGDAADLSDAAAVPDDELIGTEAAAAFTSADDNVVKKLGYRGAKRRVRLSFVTTGASSGGPLAAIAALGRASQGAVA